MNKILTDCHLHSSISFDSECPMNDIIESAIAKHLKSICITEHYDLDFPKEYNMDFTFDINNYFHVMNTACKQYKASIELLTGIELGLMPHLDSAINNLIKNYDFDYIIGSTHIIDNKDPYYPEYWANKNVREAFITYFKTSIENINSINNFDAFGHLDYISRYDDTKSYSSLDYKDYIDEILFLLIEKEKALEINSAGLRKNLCATNPDIYVIKRYKELGGQLITIGSDSHDDVHIAYGFDIVQKILIDAGFKHYNIYKQRKPYEISLI